MLKTMRANRNSEYSRHKNQSVWRSLKNLKKNTVHQFHYQVLIQRKETDNVTTVFTAALLTTAKKQNQA